MIRRFIQLDLSFNRELFGRIGELLTDPGVHAELGVPVTSEPGDLWWVHADGGFAQARILKNGTMHLRYVYASRREVREELVSKVVAEAKSLKVPCVYTNGRKTDTLWKHFEFKPQDTTHRGDFIRWEKTI